MHPSRRYFTPSQNRQPVYPLGAACSEGRRGEDTVHTPPQAPLPRRDERLTARGSYVGSGRSFPRDFFPGLGAG